MGQEKPTFKGGNISIASALNRLANALWRHGVNPAGRPGWSESADGWVPPVVFEGGESSVFPWALNSEGDGDYSITVGTILKGDDSVSASLTCDNADYIFEPGVGDFLVLKIVDLVPTSYEIELLSSWPESGGAAVSYTGSVANADFELVARYYPLWKFVASSTDPSRQVLGDGLSAIKCAPHANLVIQDSLYRTDTGEVLILPRFGISHRAI
jgi:hypothetical protein